MELLDNKYIIPEDWRIIATMNTYDKTSLYEMSYAFMRRFAFIQVQVPYDRDINTALIQKYLSKWGLEAVEDICFNLADLWKQINEKRKIGPAIIEDMYKHIYATRPEYDYAGAITQYVFPQFEGLTDENQISFIKKLTTRDFIQNQDDIRSFACEFFNIDQGKFD